jgi:hypothetical protein
VSLLHAGQIKDNEHVATISKNFFKKIQYHLKSSKAKEINKLKKKKNNVKLYQKRAIKIC